MFKYLMKKYKLFRLGLRAVETKSWFIVWNKKTGTPVKYSLPFVSEMHKDFDDAIFHEWLSSLNVNNYRKSFMTEENVDNYNKERLQHLKNKIKVVDEEIEKNKDKTVNFPKDAKYHID